MFVLSAEGPAHADCVGCKIIDEAYCDVQTTHEILCAAETREEVMRHPRLADIVAMKKTIVLLTDTANGTQELLGTADVVSG